MEISSCYNIPGSVIKVEGYDLNASQRKIGFTA